MIHFYGFCVHLHVNIILQILLSCLISASVAAVTRPLRRAAYPESKRTARQSGDVILILRQEQDIQPDGNYRFLYVYKEFTMLSLNWSVTNDEPIHCMLKERH